MIATRSRSPLLLLLLLLGSAIAFTLAAPSPHERVWEPEAFSTATDNERPNVDTAPSHSHSHLRSNTGGSAVVPLQYADSGLSGYYGEVSLGTPPQRFRMMFSSMLFPTTWIPNFVAPSTNRVYNHTQSHTYHANGTPFMMRGLLGGFLSEDELRIGDLVVARQLFAEITVLPASWLPHEYDGVLSLGFPTQYEPSQIKTPFHELVDNGALAQPLFAFYLNRAANTSALTFGMTNTRHYTGELAFAPVVRTTSWTAKLDGIRADGQSITAVHHAQFWVEFPTLLFGTASDVAKLAEIVGAKIVNRRYVLDCDAAGPDIEIVVGGATFAFTKREYTLFRGGECVWAVQNNIFPGFESWVIGGLFLEKVYTVFHWGDDRAGHNRRMGFALRA